jgi:hypothetical protein
MIDHELVRRFWHGHNHDFNQVPNCDSEGSAREAPPQSSAAFTDRGEGSVVTLVPEVPLKSLKRALTGMSTTDLREKKDRL